MKTFKIVDCYYRRHVFRTVQFDTYEKAREFAREYFWLTKCLDIELYECSGRKLTNNITFKTFEMFEWIKAERSRKYG